MISPQEGAADSMAEMDMAIEKRDNIGDGDRNDVVYNTASIMTKENDQLLV